ncbi:DUF3048 domain-containing protein [Prauserella sp. PE36]|uniref:DUF3048 domain-containing protein n=1 Tax=Prauserella endophytica TaxID=1592324 RepID=A0ABY2S5P2_9PSEU|nr:MULTISPECIES: DUF3048 domain-containing protein [Prauserella]PXY30107.1 hypothetical protein BAY59_12875 [Prauserella coralliicola]RBM22559.1 DUF3048 domain-containing protein [Prauserella sp. PE36]TKG71172.1 DUF3048 domain-containing protein [Prauserella endophytica]
MPGKPIRQLIAAVSVFAVVGAAVAALLLFGDDAPTRPGAPQRGSSAVTTPAPADRVLVVKIDNVAAARPQTGLSAADVVYVEPVEGGLTRLAAVYSSRLPRVVGPVRSARETDVELLAQYGHPTLAFSGAAPEILPLLRRASMTTVTERRVPRAYFRDGARPRPHNLFARPDLLPAGTGPGPRHVLDTGPAPGGGTPTASHAVGFRAASYEFRWARRDARWHVWLDGSPLLTTEAGQAAAATVVVQRVAIRQGAVEDAAGSVSPVARTVGTGPVTVLRDGRAFPGTWSRPSAGEGTTFTTASGEPLPLAEGPVWILLVPR